MPDESPNNLVQYTTQLTTMGTSVSPKPAPQQRRSTIPQLITERQETIMMMPDLPSNKAKKEKL